MVAKNRKRPLRLRGVWMKPISKLKAHGFAWYRAVDLLLTPLISYAPNTVIKRAATVFYKQAINANGLPKKVVIDKSGTNQAGLKNSNILLMLAGLLSFIEICQVNYLNNLVEQDHRFIKKITKPMMSFKAFHSAKATLDGIVIVYMIRKRQLSEENIPPYKHSLWL